MNRGLAFLTLTLGAGVLFALVFWRLAQRPVAPTPPRADAARVVLFAPNLTETACRLGYGDRIVGITDYCVWPPEILQRPKVGGMLDPNLERITSLGPDLLVVQGESELLRGYARQQGLRLAEVKMDDDLTSILEGFARVDSVLCGSGQRGRSLADEVRQALAAVGDAARDRPRPKVLLILGHEPASLRDLYTMGRGSFLNELVDVAGGVSQTADHPRAYFHLSLETLMADPPDVAIELRPGDPDTAALREEISRPWRDLGLDDVRVELLTFDGAMIPGPRVAEMARHLQSAIHPELGRR